MNRREVLVRPQARAELQQARAWYQERSDLLAQRFRRLVLATFDEIAENPETWPILRGNVRRALTHGFPYAVFYAIEPEGIVVLSILHQARSPRRWPTGT